MNVRDCVGKNLKALGHAHLSEVYKSRAGYVVKFLDCTLVEAKGHDQIENVRKPRQARSSDRIQKYGEWGTSI
jgi:hypothetical protein